MVWIRRAPFVLTMALAGCVASGVIAPSSTSTRSSGSAGTSGTTGSTATTQGSSGAGTTRGGSSGGGSTGAGTTKGSSKAGGGSSGGTTSTGSTSGGSSGLTLTPVSFTPLPASPDLVAPGRGAEFWNGVIPGVIDIPVAGSPAQTLNYYYRFLWSDFEDLTQGQYDWTKFDAQINVAIQSGWSFSFGIMPVCDGCGNSGYSYPTYLHTQMQAEAVPDWLYSPDGIWIPNWNSTSYLTAWQNLLNAVAAHIQGGASNGQPYANVIYYVDIRGYGNWGEWHTYPWYCSNLTSDCNGTAVNINAAALATPATLENIVNAHVTAFPNFPLVALIAAFSDEASDDKTPDFTYFVLTAHNSWGPFGWRRDNWGDPGYTPILDQNPGSYNGVAFSDLIMAAWQYGPIVGEPLNDSGPVGSNGAQCDFYDLQREVALYHATSFGNGNIPNPGSACAQANLIAASAASGYRLLLDGGGVTTPIGSNLTLGVQLLWKNVGLAPPYQSWNVVFNLLDGANASVWSGTSSFSPKLFLPQATDTSVTDTFALPASVASGSYSLTLTVEDPNGYRAPLPLAIAGQNADGSYTLASVTVP